MFFLRYHLLKEKLRERTLAERESLPYLVVFAVLTSLLVSFPMQTSLNVLDVSGGVLAVVITIAGTVHAYRCNGGNQGFDFIKKYTVLGWIVACRMLVILLPVFLVLGFLAADTDMDHDATTWHDALFHLIIEAVYYQRLGRHLADTR